MLLLAITILSLVPIPTTTNLENDKIQHLIAYAVIAFPIGLVRPHRWRSLLIFCLLWSGIIEIIQPNLNRSGEWLDFVANLMGIWLGIVATLPFRLALRNELSKDRL